MEQLTALLHTSKKTMENRVSAGPFPIATYKEGRARVASAESVAAYLQRRQEEAEKELGDLRESMTA